MSKPPRRPSAGRRAAEPGTALERLLNRIDAAVAGTPSPDTVPTGFPSVDALLGGGLRREDLVLLGGDVGSGKSALALAIALRAARAGHSALYLSGEMGEERLRERALALEGRVAIDELRQGKLSDEARASVGAAAYGQRGLPLAVVPLLGSGPDELDSALDRVPPPALVVVDYLQLVGPPHPVSRQEERTALAARTLKALALRRGVAVLAIAQLPGFRRDRPDPRPTLADFGATGAPKQHADVVLGLYREEMYRPGNGVEGAAELLVLKNRGGGTGFADLYFHPRWLRFDDLLDPD
ncbi:MAG TPA: DnaB-like helicase C-terminal domain-containing protein [Gemmatimonadales bacterium]|nr:DnaB-like helicase C-terminal domain-containing protein [Gemmatimonadales bacterium]